MEIKVAKSAGFCFGVDRAVNTVYKLYGENKKVVTFGPIIHNKMVVKDLEVKGVKTVESVDECSENDLLVIRSHGVPRSVYNDLEDKNIKYVDATCPFVSKIHRIVSEKSEQGYLVLIAGNFDHPEVIGISGHCKGKYITFKNVDELIKLLEDNKDFLEKNKVVIVSQTTFNVELWKQCIHTIKKLYTNIEIFDTICNATNERQSEAIELSKECDLMIVIGDRSSSNTNKLKEVCSENCKTEFVESMADLDEYIILSANKIGITAGASTPAYIIREVVNKVEEFVKNSEEDYSFAELFEKSCAEKLYVGKKIKGIVTYISVNEVHVDIGGKQSGIIPLSELTDEPGLAPSDVVKKGEEIDVIVLKISDLEGTVTLSKKRCDFDANFEEIENAYKNGDIVQGTVSKLVKGGLIVLVKGVRVFIPASLSSYRKVENFDHFLNTSVRFKIIEVNKDKRRILGSIKEVLNEERLVNQERILSEIEQDKVYTGKVKFLTTYGAFVDIGGMDGMVHISDLSWRKIKHPSDVVKEGDVIEVYVKSFDKEKCKISLGYKKLDENPWKIFEKDYKKEDVVTVKVVSITQFGAFAEILPGVDGLIHISQISDEKINKIEDALYVNQILRAKIIDIDIDKKRISLSIKALNDKD